MVVNCNTVLFGLGALHKVTVWSFVNAFVTTWTQQHNLCTVSNTRLVKVW